MAKLSFSRQVLPLVALIGIAVAAIIVWRTQPDRTMTQPAITPASAPQSQAGGSVAGSGVIEPSSELIAVGTTIAGVIERVDVAAGDRVVAGQPLFVIDSRDARARVSEAEARIVRLRAEIRAADTSLAVARRQRALYDGVSDPRAVSRQEINERQGVVDEAAAGLAVARGQLREAEAALSVARTTLERHIIRAPRAATVLQLQARAGEYAPAAAAGPTPLLTLGVTDPLHVRIDIDENEIERLALGRSAIISPRGNAAARVQVAFVRTEPLVVPKRSLTNASNERVDVRVLQLIYALPSKGHRMFVGQQVDAYVPARSQSK